MAYAASYTPKPPSDVFTSEQRDTDRRGCRRTVPMRVLALGLGRTGTASLRTALKELGYEDTYHMMSASVENPPDCLLWQDAFAAKFDGMGKFAREDWDRLLGHCQAVCDWPAVAFAEELIEAYPEAKVILNTRNVDSWYESTLGTVNWRANDPELRLLSRMDWAAGQYYPMLRKFWDCFFDGDFETSGKEKFRTYHAKLRRIVPAHRLLEYQVKQGWEPLCKFLERPIPPTSFPHTNDSSSFVQRCQNLNRRQMLNVLLRMSGTGIKDEPLKRIIEQYDEMNDLRIKLGELADEIGAPLHAQSVAGIGQSQPQSVAVAAT